jgi:hypothetical protein
MSKWLGRGFGSNSPAADQTTSIPEPPRNTGMPAAASASAYDTHSSQHMVGYGSPANAAMDVDNQRSKYAPHPHYQGQGGSSSKYDGRSSRSARDPEEGHRARSGRPSSRGQSSRSSRHPQQPSGTNYSSSRQGTTNAPSSMTPSQHFSPPPGPGYGHRPMATPPSDNVQPTFPPPAVTSESPTPSDQAQRRPAYLLHRDLVIGKGSYGQVCIASRGEAEGHTPGRSGKRKKYACKCVMLRNDPKYISKLQEEVNVLRELRGHDNVIRLYDVFCVDNELFIITELGRGGDLFHLLTTHPKHGVTEAYAGK